MSDVLVIGCGLIGTSIGLALQGSEWGDVALDDVSSHAVATAVARGAGRRWDGQEKARLVVVAVPPNAIPSRLLELQRRDIGQTYTHVCSVQSQVQREVEALSSDASRVVGGHPLAGREVSGAQGALLDLFVGRPWAICATARSDPGAVADVTVLAELCGAVPVAVPPEPHDEAVALLSHLPQVLSSALAGLLVDDTAAAPLTAGLAGPGLADATRLAGSDPELWIEVLEANAHHVAPALMTLVERLAQVAGALEGLGGPRSEGAPVAGEGQREVLRALLVRGNAGRARVPVKRGELAGAFLGIRVDVADEPGRLAALLAAAGEAGVNVEDVRVEHVPGRPRGVIELLVSASAEAPLRQALTRDGWQVI